MSQVIWTVGLRNDELSERNIELGIKNSIWGMKNAGVHKEIKSGDSVIFLVGVSIHNIEEMRNNPTYIDPSNVFPNYKNTVLTDDFVTDFEFKVDKVLYGKVTQDFYFDSTEVWSPRITSTKNKQTGEVTEKKNYFSNRFAWQLTHKAEDVLLCVSNSNLVFHSNIIKALRSKRLERTLLNIEELGQLTSLFESIQLDDSDEGYQRKVDTAKPIKLKNGKLPIPPKTNSGGGDKWARSSRIAKGAIEQSNYQCEFNEKHLTFTSRVTNENYVEAHHMIPMEQQGKFEFSLDVPENILTLCPNCHRKFHHSTIEELTSLIKTFYPIKLSGLLSRGILVELDELVSFYAK